MRRNKNVKSFKAPSITEIKEVKQLLEQYIGQLEASNSETATSRAPRRAHRVVRKGQRTVLRSDLVEAREALHALEEKHGLSRQDTHAIVDAIDTPQFGKIVKSNGLTIKQADALIEAWWRQYDVHKEYRAQLARTA